MDAVGVSSCSPPPSLRLRFSLLATLGPGEVEGGGEREKPAGVAWEEVGG